MFGKQACCKGWSSALLLSASCENLPLPGVEHRNHMSRAEGIFFNFWGYIFILQGYPVPQHIYATITQHPKSRSYNGRVIHKLPSILKFLFYVYKCFFPECIYAYIMFLLLAEPKLGIRFSGTGVIGACERYMGTKNQTWIICRGIVSTFNC